MTAFGGYIKALGEIFESDARTRMGALCEYLSNVEHSGGISLIIGHRPYRNSGNHMAFCPVNETHRTGRKMLDLAYRLHGYTGTDCQIVGKYKEIADFWDSRSYRGRLSINVMEAREIVTNEAGGHPVMLARLDEIEYALYIDVIEILEKGGDVMTVGTRAFDFFKNMKVRDHMQTAGDTRQYARRL